MGVKSMRMRVVVVEKKEVGEALIIIIRPGGLEGGSAVVGEYLRGCPSFFCSREKWS